MQFKLTDCWLRLPGKVIYSASLSYAVILVSSDALPCAVSYFFFSFCRQLSISGWKQVKQLPLLNLPHAALLVERLVHVEAVP